MWCEMITTKKRNETKRNEMFVCCCTFAKELYRWYWWWYKRGGTEQCSIRSILLIFRITNFMVISFGWTMCAHVCYSSISLHSIELNRVCKFQQIQRHRIFFSPVFFAVFLFIFQFMMHVSLVSVTACRKKSIMNSFFVHFFFRFTQKKSQRFSQFHCSMIERALFDGKKLPLR